MQIFIFLLLFQAAEPLSDRVLVQEHQHRHSDVTPMMLAAIEAAALENNREIRAIFRKLSLEPRFIGAIPAELRPKTKTQPLGV